MNPGYTGPLYAEICPRSFSVLVRPGMRLNQIRFSTGDAALNDAALRQLHADTPLVDGEAVIDDGLGFSVDLRLPNTTLVGYRAKPHTGVIDLDKIGHYAPADYWEEVHSDNGQIILDPGAFYILVSREAVTIPPEYAAEMAPYLAMVGEFRVHYAGFFDPGFGHDQPAVPDHAACSKSAATRPPSCWNTVRSSGVWSMKKWRSSRRNFTGPASPRTTRVRASSSANTLQCPAKPLLWL